MKFKIPAILLAVVPLLATAQAQVKKITVKESARLMYLAQHPRLVDCMAVYKFDFFSNQLGLSITDSAVTEDMQLGQLRLFLNTGRLEVRNLKMKFPAELKQYCPVVARTAVEMLALKLVGTPSDDASDEKSEN